MMYDLSLLRASVRMMLRSRGVIYAMVSNPLQVVALGLLAGGLGFGIGDRSVHFFDFVLPGMATLSVLSLQDITVAIAASYKARGILRRLAVAPVSPARLIGAQVLSYLALGLVAAALALAIGAVMGARLVIGANLLWLIPLQVIVVLTALSIAFAIAGLTPNPQTANLVGGSVALPLFVLTGAFLPVAAMPAPLPDIVPYAVPYAALIEAIRGIALTGASVTAYGLQVAVGIAWLAAMFVVAARAYRFTDDR
ncbi:MAG: ABC transporter permease [Ardenticatenaceae bacterium]|nr:ABC transporter permease [Ardenticatenaceae bacterium]